MGAVAFLLTHPPEASEFGDFARQAEQELAAGRRVVVFADVEGVQGALVPDRDAPNGVLAQLAMRGVRVVVCRVCARARGWFRGKELAPGTRAGDLSDLSGILSDADRVVSL